MSQRLVEIEMFDGRSTDLAHRLYDAVLACSMRPFADAVRVLPRTVRDLGRSLDAAVADRDHGAPLFALPTYTALLELRDLLADRGVAGRWSD